MTLSPALCDSPAAAATKKPSLWNESCADNECDADDNADDDNDNDDDDADDDDNDNEGVGDEDYLDDHSPSSGSTRPSATFGVIFMIKTANLKKDEK